MLAVRPPWAGTAEPFYSEFVAGPIGAMQVVRLALVARSLASRPQIPNPYLLMPTTFLRLLCDYFQIRS